MSEIPSPEGYKLAETWEDCARHVEKGGVVESKQAFEAEWYDANIPADSYRVMPGAPGRGSWIPHRLVPLPAEVELAELRARLDALPDVPDGHELVVLPSDVVDAWAEQHEIIGLGVFGEACRDAIDRRPEPEPETERVPWREAVQDDREVVCGLGPFRIEKVWRDSAWAIHLASDTKALCVTVAPDGTVEVLR